MTTERMTAFSDGVFAVIITIMVLELKAPHEAGLHGLVDLGPVFLAYVLSFLYIAIYWNNHHHIFQIVHRASGAVLWANLHLLFWLSLIPFATSWIDENLDAAIPTAFYGFVLLMAALAWYVMQAVLVANDEGGRLATAIGRDLKGKVSPVLYLTGMACAFVAPRLSDAVYVGVALMWLIPDRRIERLFGARPGSSTKVEGGEPRV